MTAKLSLSESERSTIVSTLRLARRWLLVVPLAKGETARDAAGDPVCPLVDEAKAFCLQGLLIRCCPDMPPATFRRTMKLLHEAVRRLSDNRHEDLFRLVDDPTTNRVTLVRLVDDVLERLSRAATLVGRADAEPHPLARGRITA